MKNVVQDAEVIKQLKILKDKSDVGNAKIPPLRIAELVDMHIPDANFAGAGREHPRNEI